MMTDLEITKLCAEAMEVPISPFGADRGQIELLANKPFVMGMCSLRRKRKSHNGRNEV